jgi:cobalamin biosynthesis protein CobT
MVSLTDLFNPTFLTFLVILVLVVALVVVYFESKMREQNHKINSMFSIVSTLAEDMTGMKMGMNQIAATQFGGVQQQVDERIFHQPLEEKKTKLITVSDDEYEDEDYEDDNDDSSSVGNIQIESGTGVCIEEELSFAEDIDEDLDEDLDEDEDEDEDEELSEENAGQEQFKVFKLNISKDDAVEDTNEESDIEDINEESDIEELDSDNDLEDLEEKNIAPVEETKIDISDLKTISINLEESTEKIDYKKLQLPKLKSIVVEKGLATTSDTSKLKKAELLKLLGIE